MLLNQLIAMSSLMIWKTYFNNDELEFVRQQRVYPYEFMDNKDKFEYPSLSSQDKCYSSWRLSVVSGANYQHVLNA